MDDGSMKLVSVIVPNYNCGRYLDKCIAHLVDQTYTHLEIIICDDASTDNSLEIIRSWQKKDGRIRLLTNMRNEGIVKTSNKCLSEANGAYIMMQDADDWSEPNRVERQVATLEQYDADMCVTNFVAHYVNGKKGYEEVGPSMLLDIRSKEIWGATPTLMFRRGILKDIPGYPEYFDRIAGFDRYFIMDILHKHKGYYLNEFLYNWLIHPHSDHRSIQLKQPRYLTKMVSNDIYLELKRQRIETGTDWVKENNFDALKKYEQELIKNEELIADRLRVFACIQIDHGNYKSARKLLWAAIKTAPFFTRNYYSLIYFIRSKYFGKKTITPGSS